MGGLNKCRCSQLVSFEKSSGNRCGTGNRAVRTFWKSGSASSIKCCSLKIFVGSRKAKAPFLLASTTMRLGNRY